MIKTRPIKQEVDANIRRWNIPQPNCKYEVLIHCTTYNHERYIEDALKGFVMQKTNFSFCAIIIDDCSTNNSPSIIRKYAEVYPNVIKPILLGENHMQHGKMRDPYFEAWHKSAKYIAECEGDDFWTDPYKLQKQYDIMEAHPECSLCFHAHTNMYPDGKSEIVHPFSSNKLLKPEDVIMIADGMVATATIFYRREYRDGGIPEFWIKCPVGDIPARLFYASKGQFAYIDDDMSKYRLATPGSWSGKKKTIKEWFNHQKSIIQTFREFDVYTEGKYHLTIKRKIRKLYIEMYYDAIASVLRKIMPPKIYNLLRIFFKRTILIIANK